MFLRYNYTMLIKYMEFANSKKLAKIYKIELKFSHSTLNLYIGIYRLKMKEILQTLA
jgi:hypothetical protein